MKILRKIFAKFLALTLFPSLKIYLAKPRDYSYQGIRLTIQPGVFHPGFFFSTQFLLNYIQPIPLSYKSLLELGAGSGLISFYADRQGAKVTASDISKTAVENMRQNQERNSQKFELVQSDLFEKFSPRKFDIILINPPYYKKNPKAEADFAWYCGENSEYFSRLFSTLHKFIDSETIILMVLSEDCAIVEIKEIAKQNNFTLEEVKRKRIWLEQNFIFGIKATTTE